MGPDMDNSRILIVEDDEDIAGLIVFRLEQAGFITRHLDSGKGLFPAIRDFNPRLIMLDLMLPDVDGLDICRRLKQNPDTASIPVLMVTARGTEADRIAGFETGADDYIVKPFSPRELVLRAKAVLSRAYPESPSRDTIELAHGPVVLKPESHRVEVDGQEVRLTATEFKLLKDLMLHRDMVRTREVLLDRVWGYSFDGYARTVDTHIRRLRKKMGCHAGLIETVRGVGYRFRAS